MFPTISEYVLQQRINVGQVFFNRFMSPMGLALIALMGAGPLFAWRRTSARRLWDQFWFPVAAMMVTVAALLILWPPSREVQEFFSPKLHIPVALVCFGLVAFCIASIGQEFYRGARVRRQQTGTDPLTALIGVLFAKRRKYGGYIVHLGIAVMFFGFGGKAYTVEKTVTVAGTGETWRLAGYEFRYDDLQVTANENRQMVTATVSVTKDGAPIGEMHPGRWTYTTGNQETTTEVVIDRGFIDVYLVLNGFEPQSRQANFVVYLNPLVNFIWLGFGIMALGTGICIFPVGTRRSRAAAAAAAAVLLLAAGDARAQNQAGRPMEAPKHEIVQGVVTEGENAPPVAKKLWADLVCLCGGCQRETLAACKCAVAKKERDGILAMLDPYDLSTPEGEALAYAEVVESYKERFGGNHVLNVPPDTPFNKMAWAVPYAAFGGAILLVGLMVRGWVRRGRRAAAPAPLAAAPEAKRSAYDDKLDDELDELE
jgi:cytochrome c-type biogenesis protein CcmF